MNENYYPMPAPRAMAGPSAFDGLLNPISNQAKTVVSWPLVMDESLSTFAAPGEVMYGNLMGNGLYGQGPVGADPSLSPYFGDVLANFPLQLDPTFWSISAPEPPYIRELVVLLKMFTTDIECAFQLPLPNPSMA